MKYPNVLTVSGVIAISQSVSVGLPDGRWVPARPEGFMSWQNRWRAAWLVFTGRADALLWDQQPVKTDVPPKPVALLSIRAESASQNSASWKMTKEGYALPAGDYQLHAR